ncbi:hypothetical protein MHF_1062 [Mycoplasma haemofelis Ohio2]|uniref:Uncharacterized protein n=1 Tax=Mycoplasma haemofelis (strain Ohio2) TaxID=859194 RepID=F6FJF7_MYCHI|nr:hypothetical protein MHF_1062 [Mycoplasma haemofelis Ohio2]
MKVKNNKIAPKDSPKTKAMQILEKTETLGNPLMKNKVEKRQVLREQKLVMQDQLKIKKAKARMILLGGSEQTETGEKGTDSEPKGGEDNAASGEGETKSDDGKGGSLGLENGSKDAENLNVHGNAYGTRDERMTQQDIETVKSTCSSLLEIQKQLDALKD